jgi:hypothetical protein
MEHFCQWQKRQAASKNRHAYHCGIVYDAVNPFELAVVKEFKLEAVRLVQGSGKSIAHADFAQ